MTTQQTPTRARISPWPEVGFADDATTLPEPAQRHDYLTDGVNLYRFVRWVNRSVTAMFAELEDCRSLDIVLVTAEHLARSPLRPVGATS